MKTAKRAAWPARKANKKGEIREIVFDDEARRYCVYLYTLFSMVD